MQLLMYSFVCRLVRRALGNQSVFWKVLDNVQKLDFDKNTPFTHYTYVMIFDAVWGYPPYYITFHSSIMFNIYGSNMTSCCNRHSTYILTEPAKVSNPPLITLDKLNNTGWQSIPKWMAIIFVRPCMHTGSTVTDYVNHTPIHLQTDPLKNCTAMNVSWI